jgi:hypothetical protein
MFVKNDFQLDSLAKSWKTLFLQTFAKNVFQLVKPFLGEFAFLEILKRNLFVLNEPSKINNFLAYEYPKKVYFMLI